MGMVYQAQKRLRLIHSLVEVLFCRSFLIAQSEVQGNNPFPERLAPALQVFRRRTLRLEVEQMVCRTVKPYAIILIIFDVCEIPLRMREE
jgi:hypothetical protein